ncbi:Topoisomerase 1-associated factor 1 [Erysiphe neolycopersici]|uniref:Topoisomerase 1-associated factor 1 n=1 Tax=Erysiphe neolycopersici TaxID=212602 RepID=A0A420I2C8_9PEZI|nr:Topoisomerase 1-associated factor 1 [Erysiphe neolycopersici]
MELADGEKEIVDPDVKAHVSSIVSALGGSGADENGQYILGDDALACLRDLKRWLKLYDEKVNRLDVARCLAESNVVGGDILLILAAWPEYDSGDRLKFKAALSCLELLVPLTWPIKKDPLEMTQNHHRHVPYLQIAQAGYKRSILNFDGARILHTTVRCALPSIAEPKNERTSRDEGIIKLLLYFLRNIAMIEPPKSLNCDEENLEISRSALIDAFQYQDIFHLLLAVSSTMGEEFDVQDVIILDIIFHILKGIDVEEIFSEEKKKEDIKIDELKRLRKKEAAMLSSYQNNAPTRHNRFGSMAWIQREDAKMASISSSAAIVSKAKSFAKMDSTKKYKPPRRPVKVEKGPLDFYTPVTLGPQATKSLVRFVEDFLDACFNPFFSHVRKTIDRDADRVQDFHPTQFFYLVNWFLQAERIRMTRNKEKKIRQSDHAEELGKFSLIANVFNQEMFITLNRVMASSFENKKWLELSAVLKCFSQILLTVQEMNQSLNEEDQEIAGNILSRIFYEETVHDLMASITRTYKDQGFGYLESVTDTALNYLRVLENYSKENTDLQVRSKKKPNRKKKKDKAHKPPQDMEIDKVFDDGNDMGSDDDDDDKNNNDDDDDDIDDDEDDDNDEAKAIHVSRERKLDFRRVSSRFVTQGCVDTFVTFTHYYHELSPAQLKRAHRFFYRVAFKNDMCVMLFRVDIIALFNKMIKGPNELDTHPTVFKEWNELIRQIFKRCTRKIQERPELAVEMLFSKNNSIASFFNEALSSSS